MKKIIVILLILLGIFIVIYSNNSYEDTVIPQNVADPKDISKEILWQQAMKP